MGTFRGEVTDDQPPTRIGFCETLTGHVGDEMLEGVDQRCGAERVPHRGYLAGGLLAADADLGQVPFDFVEDRL